MKHQACVYIGRFQPFHLAHLEMVKEALLLAENVVLVLGSHNAARNSRNPFTSQEREKMIRSCFDKRTNSRLHFVGVRDYFYADDFWANEVRSKVNSALPHANDIVLLGYEKDHTSYYLKLFPEWPIQIRDFSLKINACEIRSSYFENGVLTHLPENVTKWLHAFKLTSTYQSLYLEFQAIRDYKSKWANVPYPVTFVTVDAVVLCCGHVLLIRRKGYPGRGLLALPGGFLDQNELLHHAVIRELKEETQINLEDNILGKALERVQVFSHPLRSSRGRTITHAHLFRLKTDLLPKIKACDDASEALWVPLLDVPQLEREFFEDHMHMISALTRSY